MNRIVLFEPEKPANTGNIIRTCKALDSKLTIIGHVSFDLSDKALRRAEMDYCIGFEIERFDTIDEFLEAYPYYEGFYVTRYGKHIYSNMDYSNPSKNRFFMFGRESTGIPKEVLAKHIDHTIRIPMMADSRSLNLSNSVSIVLSEALRQQNFYGLSTKEEIKGEDFLDQFRNDPS